MDQKDKLTAARSLHLPTSSPKETESLIWSRLLASRSHNLELTLYVTQYFPDCLIMTQMFSFLLIWPWVILWLASPSVGNCRMFYFFLIFLLSLFLKALLVSNLSLLKDLNYRYLYKTTYASRHNQTNHSKAFSWANWYDIHTSFCAVFWITKIFVRVFRFMLMVLHRQ